MDNSDDKKDETSSQTKEVPAGFQKICLVCGDKALGYNFNAISCESCKAFFRRNALSSKEFKCPFTNNCAISVVTRRFCQKCRLNKCLAIGMVKDFIMSEEDKAEKRRKIEENRAKKRQLRDSEDAVSSSKCIKRDDEKENPFSLPVQDTVIQYDSLTTTCSPSSTSVQSPLSVHDLESSLQSPAYQFPPNVQSLHETHSNDTQYHSGDNQYPSSDTQFPSSDLHYQSSDIQYPTDDTQYNNDSQYGIKVMPIDEKSVINRALYAHRMMSQMEPYNRFNDVESDLYTEPPKQNTIRSLLTNGDQSIPYKEVNKSQHVCEELPSTSSDPDVNKARDILQDVERIEPNSMESILCEAIKLEFEAYTSVNPCSGSSRELNEVERAKLNELIVANKALNAPIEDDISQLIGDMTGTTGFKGKHDPRLITIVNLTAVAIRRFIKMAKKINAFKNMCEEDQVALLKGGCIEMMVLRSTMTYDGQRNQWKIPHCQEQLCGIRTDLLKLAKGNLYRTHESFITTFEQGWRTDENIILVMCAILLFSPDRARVVHRDVIKLEQNSYYYLLRRYLESVYPGCEAKSTFLKLIKKILELRKLSEEITGVYLDVNPIEPLLMEIFDLKNHAA